MNRMSCRQIPSPFCGEEKVDRNGQKSAAGAENACIPRVNALFCFVATDRTRSDRILVESGQRSAAS
jgi:hypothetical protein